MKRENPFSLWGLIGAGVVIAAALGFFLLSLGRGIGQEPTPMPTPVPTAAPTPFPSPLPTFPLPTASPVVLPNVPRVAPDFTLERADGSQFALAAQLAEGPVVLVFVRAVGG